MTKYPHNDRVTISNEEINQLPLGSFEGPIEIIDQPNQLEEAFGEINEHTVVGFDTETKPVFVSGHYNKVSLVQIALPKKSELAAADIVAELGGEPNSASIGGLGWPGFRYHLNAHSVNFKLTFPDANVHWIGHQPFPPP